MKKNPWLKKIIIMALIIFLFSFGLKQYSKYYPEHLQISYKLVLVSAYYQPEVPTNPAKLTFTQILPDNNGKPKVLKTTTIFNINPAHRDSMEPFGKTGNLIQSEEQGKYFFFGAGYDPLQDNKYFQFFPFWYDNKSEKVIIGKKYPVEKKPGAGYPSGIDSREETILHSNGFITAVPVNVNADTLLKTMTIR
ncbi:MAG: hypothetical protein LWY06_10080, partial [Firmicutes bacterium]|nr:hypothetical protein [Bacillota bacterium]